MCFKNLFWNVIFVGMATVGRRGLVGRTICCAELVLHVHQPLQALQRSVCGPLWTMVPQSLAVFIGQCGPGGGNCHRWGGETRAVVTAIYVWPRATASLELSGPITIHVSYCIGFYRIVFVSTNGTAPKTPIELYRSYFSASITGPRSKLFDLNNIKYCVVSLRSGWSVSVRGKYWFCFDIVKLESTFTREVKSCYFWIWMAC
jgi:hypothetical protein